MKSKAALSDPGGWQRLVELDGLRGWAALTVVVYHLCVELFGVVLPALRNPLTHALNGGIAVSIFFVLSGEALSAGFFAGRGPRAVLALAIKRPSRLSIPIFAGALATLALQATGLTFNGAAAAIVARPDWLGKFLQQPLSLDQVAFFSFAGVYTSFDRAVSANPFLWTMQLEMAGSILVFAVLLAWRHVPLMRWVVGALALALLGSAHWGNLSCFMAGVILAQVRREGSVDRLAALRSAGPAGMAAVLLALAVSGHYHRVDEASPLDPLLAELLVAGVAVCQPFRAFLSGRVSRVLGTLSFPLYLLQFPVLVSFTSWAIVAWSPLTPARVLAIIAVSLLAMLLAAAAFAPVERMTRRIGEWVERLLLPDRPRTAGSAGAVATSPH